MLLVTVLDCILSSVTTICVSGLLVYQLPLWPSCVWKIHRWGMTIYPELLLVGVARWNKLLVCYQFKNKKNSPLTINNYLLKHNGVTIYIYIYLYGKCVAFCFIWETDKRGIWQVQSFYVTQMFGEWDLAGEALVLGEISFLILLPSVWTFDIISHIIIKTSTFIVGSSGNKHPRLAN